MYVVHTGCYTIAFMKSYHQTVGFSCLLYNFWLPELWTDDSVGIYFWVGKSNNGQVRG